MNVPVLVSPVAEARQRLSQVLARFRAEGQNAEPMILGSHRSAEAVLLPYVQYEALLEELGELRAFQQRYRADVAALASVRLENQEPDSFGHEIAARVVEGELSTQEAIELGRQHYGRLAANS